MKQQSFGCEIEMSGISRRAAAKTASELFETGDAQLTSAYLGHQAWSAFDAEGREWRFVYDSSICGNREQICEMITPVLFYEKDMDILMRLIRKLRENGAKSNGALRCGVHVHVSGDGHSVQSLINLVNLMAAHENQLIHAVGIHEMRLAKYCRTVDPDFLRRLSRKKPKTMEELKACWYDGRPSNRRYSATRYHMLNLHSFFTRFHTIEFRLFQFDEPKNGRKGGLHAGQLRAMVLLCLAMTEEAKRRKFISSKPQQTENEAFALRTFLVRIGFVGAEFREPRKYFLRNAQGNSAWRFRD